MGKSGIEYVDYVWNPVDGCTPASTGCENCYAKRMADRFWGDRPFSRIQFHGNRFEDPRKWADPKTILVCSMGDLFHDAVKFDWFARIMSQMIVFRQHRYLLLTKRITNMISYCAEYVEKQIWAGDSDDFASLTNHMWFGVSIEDQDQMYERAMRLPAFPAERLFLSVEPMLGPVVLDDHVMRHVGLVICGSESSAQMGVPGREFRMEWASDLREQCRQYNVPFYLKQATVDGKLVKMPFPGEGWQELPWSLTADKRG